MGEYGKANKNNGALSRKWLFPPFTVLRERGGPWRKDLWLAKGLREPCHRSVLSLSAPARPLKRVEKWGGCINTFKFFGCPEQARLVMPTEA